MLAASNAPQISAITTNNLLVVFAEFLDIDVSAGDASADTLKTYTKQLYQFLQWCDRRQLNPVTIVKDDLKKYRHWMVQKQSSYHCPEVGSSASFLSSSSRKRFDFP